MDKGFEIRFSIEVIASDSAAHHEKKQKCPLIGKWCWCRIYLLYSWPSEGGHVDDKKHLTAEVAQRHGHSVQGLGREIIDRFICHASYFSECKRFARTHRPKSEPFAVGLYPCHSVKQTRVSNCSAWLNALLLWAEVSKSDIGHLFRNRTRTSANHIKKKWRLQWRIKIHCTHTVNGYCIIVQNTLFNFPNLLMIWKISNGTNQTLGLPSLMYCDVSSTSWKAVAYWQENAKAKFHLEW